jgi:hypothetical protein
MPATYTLISSNVLTSSAASVTFSAIPATYTDLVLRMSVRDTSSAADANPRLTFNGDTASNYSLTRVHGNGSSAGSDRYSSQSLIFLLGYNGNTTTANTFTNSEVYIPSYTVSQNKPLSEFHAPENNATSSLSLSAQANLWRNTAAITSVTITGETALASGSSFYLYGISNA